MPNYTDQYFTFMDKRFVAATRGVQMARLKPANHEQYLTAISDCADKWHITVSDKIQHVTLTQLLLSQPSIEGHLGEVRTYIDTTNRLMMTEIGLRFLKCHIKLWVFVNQKHVRIVMHVPKFGDLADVRFPKDYATAASVIGHLAERVSGAITKISDDRYDRKAQRAKPL